MIKTRLATSGDLDRIAGLFDAYRQFYQQAPDFEQARQFIAQRLQRQESVILLAMQAGNADGDCNALPIVGFCQLYPTFCSVQAQPIFSLYDLFVVPEARRQGAGRVLLQAAERLARETGKARIDLTTAKTNTSAQSVYESLGWVRDEVFYAYSKAIG